jgi:hypothetical protein
MQNLSEAALKAALSINKPETVREIAERFYDDHDKCVRACIDDGVKNLIGDFWIMTTFFKDPTIPTYNVMRIKGRALKACPTPTWSQNVARYVRDKDELKWLWAIPSVEACQHYQENKNYIPTNEHCLLQHVLDFHSGALDLVCAKENKEI